MFLQKRPWPYQFDPELSGEQLAAQCVRQAVGGQPDAQVSPGQLRVLAGEGDLAVAFQAQAAFRGEVQGVAVAGLDILELVVQGIEFAAQALEGGGAVLSVERRPGGLDHVLATDLAEVVELQALLEWAAEGLVGAGLSWGIERRGIDIDPQIGEYALVLALQAVLAKGALGGKVGFAQALASVGQQLAAEQ